MGRPVRSGTWPRSCWCEPLSRSLSGSLACAMTNGLCTFDDLVRTPDDGQRYEVIDGSLVVTPMAGGEHQPLVRLLFEQIFKASSPDLVVLPGAQLHLGTDAPIHDLVVVRDQALSLI